MRFIILALGLVALNLWAFPQSLCEYQAPTTNLLQGQASFYYRYLDDPLTPGVDQSSGRLQFGGGWLVDAPERGVGLNLDGELALQGLALSRFSTQIAGTFRQYPVPKVPYFAFGGIEGALDTNWLKPDLELRAGLGYGRFTDVTPMARAMYLEEKLLSQGVLVVSLSPATLLHLAQEIGRRQLYPSTAELTTALARILESEAGATLDARSLFLIEEVLEASGLERYCGWTVQLGLGYAVIRPRETAPEFTLNLSLEGAVAPEPRSQLLFKTTLSGPYWILEEHTLNLSASYTYRMNDIASFLAQYSLRQVKPRGQVPAGNQSASFQLSFQLAQARVSLAISFSKVAEVPSWTQDFLISAGWDLW